MFTINGIGFSISNTKDGISVMTAHEETHCGEKVVYLDYNRELPEEKFGPFNNGARVFDKEENVFEWLEKATEYINHPEDQFMDDVIAAK